MNVSQQLAAHLRQVYFGGNWTDVAMKAVLKDVDWQLATRKTGSFNTIAALVYHTHYYVEAILAVLEGKPLTASDRYSFDVPTIQSEAEWQALQQQSCNDAERLAALIETIPDSRLDETFADAKYGTLYRNLQGLIEHTHYHLGQISLLKKMA